MDIPTLLFLALYATLLFLLCSLFFPDEMTEYDGYRDYYYSRKQWIFTLMTVLFAADTIGTFIKGSDYFARLGVFYASRIGAYILLCVLAIVIRNPRFHAFFAVFALVTEVSNILKRYLTIH